MRAQFKDQVLELATFSERPDLVSFIGPFSPPANAIAAQDPITRYVRRLHADLPHCQLLLQEISSGEVVGYGMAVPFSWDHATPLPSSVPDLIEVGLSCGDSYSALGGVYVYVHPRLRRAGASSFVLQGMQELGRSLGAHSLVVPVRPNWKSRYPLVPLEDYMRWTDNLGFPYDPWLRVHARLEGRILGICDTAVIKTGPIAAWEQFLRMIFPQSGQYVIPGGLTPLLVDVEADQATYIEPNVWVHHDLAS